MNEFDEYILQGEPDQREKGYVWQTAIGLQAVDGLKPSAYLIETARRHIEGDITIEEVQQLIRSYYETNESRSDKEQQSEEADKVAANMTRLLHEQTFAFTTAGLLAIHRRLFEGVFPFAGQVRDINITKKEWVLHWDTVRYVAAPDILRAVEYDLAQEKAFDYTGLEMEQIVRHLTTFVSGLWQIHPFREGNTRTTAVFTIQYLRYLGFHAENELFARHSWYFRNALVRANYQHVQKGIRPEPAFLERFFRNLLMGESHALKNRYMLVLLPEGMQPPAETPSAASDTGTRASTRASYPNQGQTSNKNILRLVKALAHQQLSAGDMMEAVGLKHRVNFMQYSLRPALREGFITKLYPDKPNHPRQKYRLTVKGMALLNSHS